MMNPLFVFPRLRYIGGATGHGLDLFMDRHARYVRVSLAGHVGLSLERVVVYGRPPDAPTHDLVDLVRTATVSQSSILRDTGQSQADAERTYGPQRGANGILNGYDAFSTVTESNPWWMCDFGSAHHLKTIHISNFCCGTLAFRADALMIDLSIDGKTWEQFYDRSAPNILNAKFEKALAAIAAAAALEAADATQAALKKQVAGFVDALRTLAQHAGRPAHGMSLAASEVMLDLVEAFLPASIEPGGKTFTYAIPHAIRQVRVVYLNGASHPPASITIQCADGSVHEHLDSCAASLSQPITDATLSIKWRTGPYAHRANAMKIEVSAEPAGSGAEIAGAHWTTLHDNAAIADICAGVAWTSFLMGNRSARCIGLIAKTQLMPRRSKALTEAYLWCRLNLHGTTQEYKEQVEAIVNSATRDDYQGTRLTFGRHHFSTPMRDRHQPGYIAAIKLMTEYFESSGKRCFLLYGTLLGAVRSGSFIPHDDDVDMGYLSDKTSRAELLAERKELIQQFAAIGWTAASLLNHVHLTFTIHVPVEGISYPIELFPVWKEHHDETAYSMYMHKMNVAKVPEALIGSTNSAVTINGECFPAPSQPEEFLALRYGATWNVPNPFFEI